MLLGCDNPNQGKTLSEASFAKPDSINADTVKPVISTAFSGKAFPVLFEAAFDSGTTAKQGDMNYAFKIFEIGKIKIESGKIIACDPVVMRDGIPFTRVFPVGEFPVELAMAKTINDERVAFSRITFSDRDVAKWEFALQPGQKPIELKDTAFYCYGVDAGTGIFIDSIANNIFVSRGQAEWERVFISGAEDNGYKGYTYNFDGHSLATFSTGYGDGCYATYIGFDETGNICRLLTDFALVSWWKL